jgi:predicted nucleic acid-binding protein
MILVDTSVWIDFLTGSRSSHRRLLHTLLEEEQDLCLTEIIFTEILQGIRPDAEFNKVRAYLKEFPIYSLDGLPSFLHAARIYRKCKKAGFTIRSTIDCMIAVVALENRIALLAKDRDFQSIAKVEPLVLVEV